MKEEKRNVHADMAKQCETREPGSYCKRRLFHKKSKKTFIRENLETDENEIVKQDGKLTEETVILDQEKHRDQEQER